MSKASSRCIFSPLFFKPAAGVYRFWAPRSGAREGRCTDIPVQLDSAGGQFLTPPSLPARMIIKFTLQQMS